MAAILNAGSRYGEFPMGSLKYASTCHSSHDLQREWDRCCALAMGLNEDFFVPKPRSPVTKNQIQVINLLPIPPPRQKKAESPKDEWFSTALELNQSLEKMAALVERNRNAYARVDVLGHGKMTQEDRSLLESTVLGFVASTANRLEALQRQIASSSPDRKALMSGIVSCMFQTLQQDVADPMAKLQKGRSKNMAVTILKEPYRCEYVVPTNRNQDDELDDMFEGPPPDHKFCPRTRPPQPFPVLDAYEDNIDENLERPESLLLNKIRERQKQELKKQKMKSNKPSERLVLPSTNEASGSGLSSQKNISSTVLPMQQEQQERDAQLQHESALLLAQVHSDLEGVQKVEQTMTEITSLLTQFSNLISQQQEDIMAIHDDAITTKDNVTKGQDSLLEAKRRTKQSKHYMATVIMCMALLLLFFNWIIP